MVKEYFSHDYKARTDKKLVAMVMKLGAQNKYKGLAAIGVYWCIVEMLYEEDGYIPTSDYERIAYELRTDITFVRTIVEDFGLFNFVNHTFYSVTALARIQKRMEKSEKARQSVLTRWGKEDNTNVKQTQNDSNTNKSKGKGKEKVKVKEKVKYADHVQMLPQEYEKLVALHGKQNTQTFIEILSAYKGSKGKTYKSDYMAILSWVIDTCKERGKYKSKPTVNISDSVR